MSTKKLFLALGVLACGLSATANDTIRMSWVEDRYYMYGRSFEIIATTGEQFVIDWGNGWDIDTITGTGGWQKFTHSYSNYYKQYTITITGLTEDCHFITLDCSGNALTDLSINCCELTDLDCGGNELSTINFSECTALKNFFCYDNHFSFSECYRLLKFVTFPNILLGFGQQYLSPQEAEVGKIVDFSEHAVFNGRTTSFLVSKNDLYTHTTDYTINNGVIIFKDTGKYLVSMTNSTFPSSWARLVVITEINVTADATLSDLSVSKGVLNPAFDNIIFNYTVEVGFDTTEITITATAKDANTVISGDIGLQQLQVGANIFTITAENDQTTWQYTVTVNRKSDVSVTEVTSDELQVTSYEIYDMLGRKIESYKLQVTSYENAIDVSHLPAGLYILRMQTNKGIITKKVIKY